MARENLVLHGLNHHRVIKSLHHFQSMEHHLPGLPATQDTRFDQTGPLQEKWTHCHHPLCRSLSFSLQIMEVVRQQQRRSIPSTLFSLSLNHDASSLSCDESNSVSLENQSKVGEDRATASEKTEQRRRGRQSRGGVGVDRDGREQRWWCGG
ncbi:hypothetical protein YC2023_099755 [Brassica napus]